MNITLWTSNGTTHRLSSMSSMNYARGNPDRGKNCSTCCMVSPAGNHAIETPGNRVPCVAISHRNVDIIADVQWAFSDPETPIYRAMLSSLNRKLFQHSRLTDHLRFNSGHPHLPALLNMPQFGSKVHGMIRPDACIPHLASDFLAMHPLRIRFPIPVAPLILDSRPGAFRGPHLLQVHLSIF